MKHTEQEVRSIVTGRVRDPGKAIQMLDAYADMLAQHSQRESTVAKPLAAAPQPPQAEPQPAATRICRTQD